MRRRASLALAALVLALLPGAGSAGEPDACRTVRFGVVGFSDVAAVTALAAEALKPLGYEPAGVNLSLPIIFASLQGRNIDVFLGNWMPAQDADSRPYLADASVEVLGPNLAGAKFTLAVPRYLYEAGLKDFASIRRHAAALDHKLYGIEPGAAANRLILGMIQSGQFGLGGFRLIESSEQGMLAELERAYRSQRPIVFLGWEPHPMNLRFPIEYLAGGDAVFGPDFGGATINTVVRAGLRSECPNLTRFLTNLKFSLRGESELMAAILDRHEAPDAAARAWLASHPQALGEWLAGVSPVGAGMSGPARGAAGTAGLDGWVVAHKVPFGDATARALEALKHRGRGVFDGIAVLVRALVDGVSMTLRAIPFTAFIVGSGLLTYALQRTWTLTLFVPLAFLFVLNQGYWAPMLETLALVLVATVISVSIALPVGIAGAHHPRLYAALRPVLDLMQTLPTFVYLIPTLVLFGLGPVPGLIATVVFALPAPVRLTRDGIAATPLALKEAALAFGATGLQLLWRVELPSARPLIYAGITQCVMLSLSMVVVAALVGAGGLGVPVVRALNSVQIGMGFESGLVIVLLAVLLDRLLRPRLRGLHRGAPRNAG